MIASLQMYDWPAMADAYGRYWQLIRDGLVQAGIKAPDYLSVYEDESYPWLRENLLLSQACGMPYRHHLHDRVTLVGTPDYGVADCPPGYYYSVFVTQRTDGRTDVSAFADARFACNHEGSQSGYAAPLVYAADHGFSFSQLLESGSHRQSAKSVAEEAADIACIDAISWRLMEQHETFASDLQVIARTEATPGLPYITGASNDREVLFEAIQSAIAELADDDRQALGLRSMVAIPSEDYLAVRDPG